METISYYQIAVSVLGGLWIISEALASIPSIKANSIFQAFYNGLNSVRSKLK